MLVCAADLVARRISTLSLSLLSHLSHHRRRSCSPLAPYYVTVVVCLFLFPPSSLFVSLICRRCRSLVSVATVVAPSYRARLFQQYVLRPYIVSAKAFVVRLHPTLSPSSVSHLCLHRRRASSPYPLSASYRLFRRSRCSVVIILLCRSCRMLFSVTAVFTRNLPTLSPSLAARFSRRRRLPPSPYSVVEATQLARQTRRGGLHPRPARPRRPIG